jgi:hypothetical protein
MNSKERDEQEVIGKGTVEKETERDGEKGYLQNGLTLRG